MQSIPRMETMTTIEDSCPLYASISTYVSTPRNRQIAKMGKEMGMIERYGTGIKRVRRMFTDYGLPEPRFETPPGGFALRFLRILKMKRISIRSEKRSEKS